MIKSCEDVRTSVDFYKFTQSWHKTLNLGFKETANMMCWNNTNIICPKLFHSLAIIGRKTNV